MANQAEMDYEKQFQDDLAKATALSLEQQALDEYNRTKKYGAAFTQNAQQEATNKYYAQIRRQHYKRGNTAETTNTQTTNCASASSTPQHSLALPRLQSQQQAQRRHSEITHNIVSSSSASLLTEVERSKTPPASRAENDLINFASPTSKNPESTSFEKLIEDLQKLQATNPQTALVPLGPTAAAPIYPSPLAYHPANAAAAAPMYAGSAAAVQPPAQYGVATATGALGMQLVPFVPTQQQQKVPLTNEELSKLYNMTPPPHTAPVYGARPPAHHIGFIPPMGTTGYYPVTPPVMQGSAAYSAPLHYPNAYGFQFQASGVAAQQQQQQQQHSYYPSSMAASVSAASSSSALSSVSSMTSSSMNIHQLNHSMNVTDNSFKQQIHSNVYMHTSAALSTSAPASASASSAASASASSSSSALAYAPTSSASQQANGFQNKRQTPPVRKSSRVSGSDLIDLSHEDDSRVSVLEAFDPLLHDSDEVTKRLNKY